MTSVLLAYLHTDMVSSSFMESLLGVIEHDRKHDGHLTGRIPVHCPSGQLGVARSNAVQVFLDSTDSQWLWMVDSDMGFEPDTLDRLLSAADPEHHPVVGALCYAAEIDGYDGMGGFQVRPVPALFDHDMIRITRFPRNQVIPVGATGAACLLIHRNVLEKVRQADGDRWFWERETPVGLRMGEDVSFCTRLTDLDIPVHVHTGIRTSHHKSVWITG